MIRNGSLQNVSWEDRERGQEQKEPWGLGKFEAPEKNKESANFWGQEGMFQRQESWKEGTKGSEGEQERGPGEKHFGFLKTVIMGSYQMYITVEDGCNEPPGSHHPSSNNDQLMIQFVSYIPAPTITPPRVILKEI